MSYNSKLHFEPINKEGVRYMNKTMKTLAIFAFSAVFLAGCSSIGDKEVFSQKDGIDASLDTEAVTNNDPVVKFTWARSELVIGNTIITITNKITNVRYKTNEVVVTNKYGEIYTTNKITSWLKITNAYTYTNGIFTNGTSLCGLVRTQLLPTNLSPSDRSVIIHYTIDSNTWYSVTGKNIGKTDDKLYNKFYFYTPFIPYDPSQENGGLNYAFWVEYQITNTYYISDKGRNFLSCPMPDPELPNMVLGQSVVGSRHLLLERAFVTPVYDTNGVLTGYDFQGNIQVKNVDPTNKIVKIIYQLNTTNWVRAHLSTYPYFYATNTGKEFFPNGYTNKNIGGGTIAMENWGFSHIFPADTTIIQFIDVTVYDGATSWWSDKNRCKRYFIYVPVPGRAECWSDD